MDLQLKVECYSGYKADERPRRFAFVRPGNQKITEVREVVDQWYGIGYQCFKVKAEDGNVYILRHDFMEDSWGLAAFRHGEDVPSGNDHPVVTSSP